MDLLDTTISVAFFNGLKRDGFKLEAANPSDLARGQRHQMKVRADDITLSEINRRRIGSRYTGKK